MCSHYQGIKERERYRRFFGVEPPEQQARVDIWPGYVGSFIWRQASGQNEALNGLFGLVPPWSPDTKITRLTYNARSETVAAKPSFREAWRRAQHCIIPAEAIFEPDWRSGKPVPAHISRVDGEPMGIAGLWSLWKTPQGEPLYSYTMLTVSASHHPLMRQFHKPGEEKRRVVVVPPDRYEDWLTVRPEQSLALLHHCEDMPLQAQLALPTHPTLF